MTSAIEQIPLLPLRGAVRGAALGHEDEAELVSAPNFPCAIDRTFSIFGPEESCPEKG